MLTMINTVIKQITCSLILLFLWCVIYAIKRNFNPHEIVFYESILFSMFLFLVLFISLIFLNLKHKKIIYYSLLPSYLLITLFNTTVPTILDRSVSITVLGTLKQSEDFVSIDHINKSFEKIYVYDENAVGVRLNEQMANGNVVQNEHGEYALSNKGQFVTDVMLHLSNIYNVNTAYIKQ